MSLPLSDVPVMPRDRWRYISSGLVSEVKKLTQQGQGVDGAFKAYSRDYAEAKAEGLPRASSTQTNPPDLMLTGDMMRDLQVISVSASGFICGWPAYGDRMRANANRGRAVSRPGKAIAPPTEKYLLAEVDRVFKSNIKRARIDKTVRIGKRK